MWSCHLHHGFTKVSTGSCPFWSMRAGRGEHVADSSNHSLYLIKVVQLQLSWGKQGERNVKNDLHVSIATRLHENMPLLGTVHHLSGPDMFALTRGVVCVVCNVSVGVCGVCLVVCVLVCVVCGCGVSHTLSRSRSSFTFWCTCRRHSFCSFFFKKKNAAQNSYFPWCLLFEASDLPQWFHVFFFFHFVAVSSIFRDLQATILLQIWYCVGCLSVTIW